MPELPDVTIYVERLAALTVGRPLEGVRVASPFVLRTVSPSPRELAGAAVLGIERLGKRIVLALEGERFIVIHLMIAGRLRWKERLAKVPGKVGLAAFDFPDGTLIFTEASPKKRASIHIVAGRAALAEFDRGGLDVLGATAAGFAERLRAERHTVKRALTDPTLFDGIGNAYSDEILHAARLSPFRMTPSLSDEEIARLHRACIETLTAWTRRLRDEVGDGFPDKVTAFHPEMAVHGKYGAPCPVCGTKVQRVVYADNEANYCPTCQTEGRLLADRALSRLLKEDWPRSLEELEERRDARRAQAGPATAAPAAAAPATVAPAGAAKPADSPRSPRLGRKKQPG
ncbi:MAG TPA: DNA-formamidopyrimidine glycosylase family protein [Kofleriaceae bacterium]|nr:DNA-formamidopyrimidine glycosylase family protein [Kofleriaceae bacterium]